VRANEYLSDVSLVLVTAYVANGAVDVTDVVPVKLVKALKVRSPDAAPDSM
jgi:hypothetical protein